MALQPGDNNGEAAYAPGCDSANIWVGYPGFEYTYKADSQILSLDAPTATDRQLRGGFRYATFFLDGGQARSHRLARRRGRPGPGDVLEH